MDPGAILLVYCERLGPGLWAEPLNALSNAGFFWCAWMLHREAARTEANARQALHLLAALVALVGIGSLSFHTLATRWANWLDMGFIALFNVVFVALFLRVVARWPVAGALAGAAGFVLIDRVGTAWLPPGLLSGSGFYLPALATLIALTAYALHIAPAAGRRMAGAALLFVVALAVRTLDRSLCELWPWGTHFVWHLLVAWILYRLAGTLRCTPRG